jgi:uncharacterized membrane protein YphA (DoxX/SURF4 family)
LLRAAIGVIALAQGVFYLTGSPGSAANAWISGLLAITSGASLLLGFLTPLGSAIVAVGGAGTMLAWFPAPVPNLIELRLSAILVTIVACAIVLLGPGALSVDARLFGRREIIIPRPSQRLQDR